jgi:hypothetical protein
VGRANVERRITFWSALGCLLAVPFRLLLRLGGVIGRGGLFSLGLGTLLLSVPTYFCSPLGGIALELIGAFILLAAVLTPRK